MGDAKVAAWLRYAGLSRFTTRFDNALVTPAVFLALCPPDLEALGIDSPADRKRLSDLISDLNATQPKSNNHNHNHHTSQQRPPTSSTSTTTTTTSSSSSSSLSLSAAAAARPKYARRQSSVLSTAAHPASRPIPTVPRPRVRASVAPPLLSNSKSYSSIPPALRPHPPNNHNHPTAPVTTTNTNSHHATTMTMPPSTAQAATVTVCVRKRPLSRKEVHVRDRDIVSVTPAECSLAVHELKEKVDLTKYVDTHRFAFDSVFDEAADNASVYAGTAQPLVDTLFAGGRGTCFAYGQTGSGKTYTMAGERGNPGLYTLVIRDIFDRIRALEKSAWKQAEDDGIVDDFEPPDLPEIWISFYEIYGTRLQDLLNKGSKLECREDGNAEVQIVGLTEKLCEIEEDVLDLIALGSQLRSTGTTGANDDSSRSHAVFQIELRQPPSQTTRKDKSTLIRESLLSNSNILNVPAPTSKRSADKGDEIGRLCFIDLAGSERGSDTSSSTRQTRMEGAEINKSLLALKECIRAMDKRKDHTPFRGSKLTQVLKASFLGRNCRTVMIANISPAASNCEHTLNTLRYSDRVKEIKKERSSPSSAAPNNANSTNASLAARRTTLGINGHAATFTSSRANGTLHPPPRPTPESLLEDAVQQSQQPPSSRRANSRFLPRHPGPAPLDTATDYSDMEDSRSNIVRSATTRRLTKSRPFAEPSSFNEATDTPSVATKPLRRRVSKAAGSSDNSTSNSVSAALRRTTPRAAEHASGSGSGSGSGSASTHLVLTGDRETSPVMTRQRARELGRRRPPQSSGDSLDSDGDGCAATLRRKKSFPRQSNAAESAMKFYGAVKAKADATTSLKKKKEKEKDKLKVKENHDNDGDNEEEGNDDDDDDDLLFIHSQDDLTGSIDAVMMKSNTPTSTSTATATGTGMGASVIKKTLPTRPKSKDSSSNNSKERTREHVGVDNGTTSKITAEVKQVVRMHHMQIEELMRLTEADVAIVNAAEKGELDAQEYALKLSVNLSQKLDIIKTLQTKIKMLE